MQTKALPYFILGGLGVGALFYLPSCDDTLEPNVALPDGGGDGGGTDGGGTDGAKSDGGASDGAAKNTPIDAPAASDCSTADASVTTATDALVDVLQASF